MKKQPPIESENYRAYFDELRKNSFNYTAAEAAETIKKPVIKSKLSKTSTIKTLIAMTTLTALIITGYLWLLPGKQLQADLHQGDDPKTSRKKGTTKTITTTTTTTTLDTNTGNGVTPLPDVPKNDLPNLPALPSLPTPPTPPSGNIATLPPLPGLPPLPKYEIPDVRFWIKCVSVLAGNEAVPPVPPVPDVPSIPELAEVKPITLMENELWKLGVHKTRMGTFIDLGCIQYCCSRAATYIKPLALGRLTGPLPTMVTDEKGRNFRVYGFSQENEKEIQDKLMANGVPEEVARETATLEALRSSMNNLVPILVKNDADTSHGEMHNKIILWYNPGDNLFSERFADIMKDKMIKPCQGYTVNMDTKNPKITNTELKPNIVSKTNGGACTWTDFKVYPNPVSDNFSLDFKLTEDKKLRVNLYDITGKLVKVLQQETPYTKGPYSNSFNIGGLTEGIYILAVQSTDGETWTQRIIRK